MWTARTDELAGGRRIRVTVARDSAPMDYAEVLSRWRDDAAFRSFFLRLLADMPFSAFRWETPPVTQTTVDRRFECVVIDSPGLAVEPDPDVFAGHFRGAGQRQVIEFANLGHDATMVVPCPVGPVSAYGHLAAFVRRAPERQQHALWREVGASVQRRLGARPVWLSTAGGGVAWLHVRLDDRPKYYAYRPYREML